MNKSPETYNLLTYMWVLFLSVWAGMSSHLYHVRLGHVDFDLMDFVIDIFISGFVGLLTFFLCEAGEIDPLITAVLVGVTAHMGSRAIFLFQGYLLDKFSIRDKDGFIKDDDCFDFTKDKDGSDGK